MAGFRVSLGIFVRVDFRFLSVGFRVWVCLGSI